MRSGCSSLLPGAPKPQPRNLATRSNWRRSKKGGGWNCLLRLTSGGGSACAAGVIRTDMLRLETGCRVSGSLHKQKTEDRRAERWVHPLCFHCSREWLHASNLAHEKRTYAAIAWPLLIRRSTCTTDESGHDHPSHKIEIDPLTCETGSPRVGPPVLFGLANVSPAPPPSIAPLHYVNDYTVT